MNLGGIPAKHAALTPKADAIIDAESGRRTSFATLDQRVQGLAILAKNCPEYLEVFFACARAGLIAQPLNWHLGIDELQRIVTDGEPRVIVTSPEYVGTSESLQSRCDIEHRFCFGDGGDGSFEELTAPSIEAIDDDDPLVILYTGGTTGESKGASHTHRSFYTGMLNQTVAERIVPSDVYMLTGQMFHTPVALAMNCMAHGCPAVLINFEAEKALAVIEPEHVSAFLGITTMPNWMMAVEGFDRYKLHSLRNIQYGGGPMPAIVIAAARDAFPCTLIQRYGQTEGMTMTFLSQEDHTEAILGRFPERLKSCGREGFITSVRLRDQSGAVIARDRRTTGEIWIRAEANMQGYWRKPELRAETIQRGWTRTGDIATWDERGYVYIVDRAKDMIISGGENIYSTQVEAPIIKEIVTRRDIRKYAIATGQRLRKFLDGDEAPPLFHVALFWDVVERDQLHPDGVATDSLIPKLLLEKAMAGRLKVEYHRGIFLGDELVAERTPSALYEKPGRQGPIIFYEVVMQVSTTAGEPVLTETTTRLLR